METVVEVTTAAGKRVQPSTMAAARAVITELSGMIAGRPRENAALQHRGHLLCQRIFGRRSEKERSDPQVQPLLPYCEAAAGAVAPDASDEDRAGAVEQLVGRKQPQAHRGRRPLPAELPREEVRLAPPAADRVCQSCAGEKVTIGADHPVTMDYRPAAFFLRDYIRPKRACPRCQDGGTQAALPWRPIEKGRPEPGLLAHVVTAKYGDHLPLYRQEQIFLRHGVEVSRRTLSEWCGAVADLLRLGVEDGMQSELRCAAYIQCDDTPLDVQLPEQRGKAPPVPAIRPGNMWVYRDAEGHVVYDFTWGRTREGPERMLQQYRGYVQADAAPAYDRLFTARPDLIEVGCLAHARRRFKEAAPTAPQRCALVIAQLRELYKIASAMRGKPPAQRHAARQQYAQPVVNRRFEILTATVAEALPKSPLAEACHSALNNRRALERYLEDGRLEINNNGAQRAIKPVVLGRKNWLTAGSEAAAKRAAILLSLVHTCKNLAMDPFAYRRDVIDRLSTPPRNRVHERTPRQWLKARLAMVAPPQAA